MKAAGWIIKDKFYKMGKELFKQIKKQIGSEDVFEPPFDEFNIDWNDDPSEMLEEINQELNYRLQRFHSRDYENWDKLKQDIITRYPYSYMFERYDRCISEITAEGNICYDFIAMIGSSTNSLNRWYSFRPDFTCFSDREGLKDLCDYFYNVREKDMEVQVEPMLILNGHKVYWSFFTYTDYGNPYFDDEELTPEELDKKYFDEFDLPEVPEELSLEFEQQ